MTKNNDFPIKLVAWLAIKNSVDGLETDEIISEAFIHRFHKGKKENIVQSLFFEVKDLRRKCRSFERRQRDIKRNYLIKKSQFIELPKDFLEIRDYIDYIIKTTPLVKRDKEILFLKFYQQLDNFEIAQLLKIKQSSVTQYLSHIKKKLNNRHKEIEKEQEQEEGDKK